MSRTCRPASAPPARCCYAARTQSQALAHVQSLSAERPGQYVLLDPVTRRNLELTQTLSGEDAPTLFSLLDGCRTPMGSRLLRRWLHHPLRENAPALARQHAISALLAGRMDVEQTFGAAGLLETLRATLNAFPDIERIAARLALRSVRPRELASLRDALHALPALRELVAPMSSSPRLGELLAQLSVDPDLADLLTRAIAPEPAVAIRDGGVLATGFDAELDELRGLAADGGDFLLQLETRERERTGISNLRVEFNRVHGFYIEVTKGQTAKVPEDYRRRQTLKNAERYITPELKTWEDKVLSAQDRSLAREKWLFEQLLDVLAEHVRPLSDCAAALAELDTLAALAEHARRHDWVAPELSEQADIDIDAGRHPVVENAIERFTPNGCRLDPARRMLLITGPNMGGKSTYATGRADRAAGAHRQLRAGGQRARRQDRPHLHPHRRGRRSGGRPLHLHDGNDRSRRHSLGQHAQQPGADGRDRPRHLDLRRPGAGLGHRLPPAGAQPRADAVRHALLRTDPPAVRTAFGGQRAPGGGGNPPAASCSCTKSAKARPAAATASRSRSAAACRPP